MLAKQQSSKSLMEKMSTQYLPHWDSISKLWNITGSSSIEHTLALLL